MWTEIFLESLLHGGLGLETGGVVNNHDYHGVSTRFSEVEQNVWMDMAMGNPMPITILNSAPLVFNRGPPADRFSVLQQDEPYSTLPTSVKDRSTLYKDEAEPVLAPAQRLTASWRG